jgi:hypothetical protein
MNTIRGDLLSGLWLGRLRWLRAVGQRRSFIRYGKCWERRVAFPWSGWPCRVAGAVIDEGALDVLVDQDVVEGDRCG